MQTTWIAALGMVGVLSRWGLGWLAQRFLASPYPWGTLAINLAGAFLAGWIGGRPGLSVELRTAVLVGFLGGFTTFSAYCLEGARLWAAGQRLPVFIYMAASPLLGLLLALAGLRLGRAG